MMWWWGVVTGVLLCLSAQLCWLGMWQNDEQERRDGSWASVVLVERMEGAVDAEMGVYWALEMGLRRISSQRSALSELILVHFGRSPTLAASRSSDVGGAYSRILLTLLAGLLPR